MKSLNLAVLGVVLFSSLSCAYTITWSKATPYYAGLYVEERRDPAGNYRPGDSISSWTTGQYHFTITPAAGQSDTLTAFLHLTTTETASLMPAGDVSMNLNFSYVLFSQTPATDFLINTSFAAYASGENVTSLAKTMVENDVVTLRTGVDYYAYIDALPAWSASVRDNMPPGGMGYYNLRATSAFDITDLQEAVPVPEPAAILLLGMGLGVFAFWGRRLRG